MTTTTIEGTVVWFTGRPAAGKSTLAARVAERLRAAHVAVALLDGDEVRRALVPAPAHDEVGRDAFYRSLVGLAALLAGQGLVVLVAATAYRRSWRELARAQAPRFLEVHVDTPLDECRRRDPKGLYAAAAALPTLPGVGVAYEVPLAPDLVAAGGGDARTVDELLALLQRR